ncbi:hypothetical protein F5Y15DRAFT_413292 [Xylariaceae sp. FL0016]|nr:hypothetical protein F5Y15DRAFT_413292 [Xylariaceae sp. FL0016]
MSTVSHEGFAILGLEVNATKDTIMARIRQKGCVGHSGEHLVSDKFLEERLLVFELWLVVLNQELLDAKDKGAEDTIATLPESNVLTMEVGVKENGVQSERKVAYQAFSREQKRDNRGPSSLIDTDRISLLKTYNFYTSSTMDEEPQAESSNSAQSLNHDNQISIGDFDDALDKRLDCTMKMLETVDWVIQVLAAKVRQIMLSDKRFWRDCIDRILSQIQYAAQGRVQDLQRLTEVRNSISSPDEVEARRIMDIRLEESVTWEESFITRVAFSLENLYRCVRSWSRHRNGKYTVGFCEQLYRDLKDLSLTVRGSDKGRAGEVRVKRSEMMIIRRVG